MVVVFLGVCFGSFSCAISRFRVLSQSCYPFRALALSALSVSSLFLVFLFSALLLSHFSPLSLRRRPQIPLHISRFADVDCVTQSKVTVLSEDGCAQAQASEEPTQRCASSSGFWPDARALRPSHVSLCMSPIFNMILGDNCCMNGTPEHQFQHVLCSDPATRRLIFDRFPVA